jgi:hypothetical protein
MTTTTTLGAGQTATTTGRTYDSKNRWIALQTGIPLRAIQNFRDLSRQQHSHCYRHSGIWSAIRDVRMANKSIGDLSGGKSPAAYAARLRDRYMEAFRGDLVSVEIECVFSRSNMVPKEEELSRWLAEVSHDGSLRYMEQDESFENSQEEEDNNAIQRGTAEIKLTFRPDNITRLKKVLDKLRHCGAEVNTTCGTHIHLDQRGVERRQANIRAKRLIKALPALRCLVAHSRFHNEYCQENRPILVGKPYFHNHGRYLAVNFYNAHRKHRTIEIRLHGGTLDVWKIHGWVQLCRFISLSSEVDALADKNAVNNLCEAKGLQGDVIPSQCPLRISIEDLIRMKTIPGDLRMYVWKRFRQFYPQRAENLRNNLFESRDYNLTDGMAIS